MKGYGQFCPVAKAAEIFVERWTPLVLRELVCGSHRFSHLHRGVPLMSRTLLAQRLAAARGRRHRPQRGEDEGARARVVAVVAAIVAGLVAAGPVVLSAPSFFAEVLADGAISYGLYRRFRRLKRDHWIDSAVSRTWLPFAVAVVFLALAGAAMQWYAPGADSIGDVWTAMNASANGGRPNKGMKA